MSTRDVIRESVKAGRARVDGGRGLRADRRRARRAPARGPGDASQRVSAAALGHAGRARSSCRSPSCARAATSRRSCSRASAPSRRWSRSSSRPMSAASRRGASISSSRASGCGSRSPRSAGSAGLLDEQVEAFRERPLEGRYPYLFVDAKVEKVRDGGRVVRKCVVDRARRPRDRPAGDHRPRRRRGRDRGVLARVPARPRRARPGRRPARDLRRPPGPEGRDRAGARRAVAALHRALPHGLPRPRPQGPARRCSAALIRPIFNAASTATKRAERLSRGGRAARAAGCRRSPRCSRRPKTDILAFYAFPAEHWRKLRSTNPLERFNREIGRRTDVVGIFPDDRSLIRLVSMLAIEANDEWLVGRRYISRVDGALLARGPRRTPIDTRQGGGPELHAA